MNRIKLTVVARYEKPQCESSNVAFMFTNPNSLEKEHGKNAPFRRLSN